MSTAQPIVVTGAAGQLGSELCRQLGGAAFPIDLPEIDLTDHEATRRTLVDLRPRAVVNTAAYTQVDRAEEEAEMCLAVNDRSVVNLADVCTALDCPLVQISTDYVFGQTVGQPRPWKETDEPQPAGVYAESKCRGERAAATCSKHLIVRTCGLYAPPADGKPFANFVETMLRLAKTHRTLRVVSDQRCTPSYVPHVAGAVRSLLDQGARGTFHVTNSGETTWFEFAREIFRQANHTVEVVPITTAEYGAAAPRPAYSVLDTAKYAALEGSPLPTWTEGLAEFMRARRDR